MPKVKNRTVEVEGLEPSSTWQLGEYIQALTALESHCAPAGSQYAALTVEGTLCLLDKRDSSKYFSLNAHANGGLALSYNAHESLLASAGQDGKIRIWRVGQELEKAHELDAGAAWVERVVWLKGGQQCVSAAGKVLRGWSKSGELICKYDGHSGTVLDISPDATGELFASVSSGKLLIHRVGQPDPIEEFDSGSAMLVVRWSPCGRFIAAGNQDASVRFWIVSSGKSFEMRGYPTKVKDLAWRADSRFLATGGAAIIGVWDFAGKGPVGSKPTALEAHTGLISALSFQPKGDLLLSGGQDNNVFVWSLKKRHTPLAHAELKAGLASLAWDSSGSDFAVGSAEGEVAVYENVNLNV